MRFICIIFLITLCSGEDTIDSCYSETCSKQDSSLYRGLGTECKRNKQFTLFWWFESATNSEYVGNYSTSFKDMNSSAPIKLLIQENSDNIIEQIKDAYFKVNNSSYTIVRVGYNTIGLRSSVTYSNETYECNLLVIADQILYFLHMINATYGFQVESMHLIGHSFGAHLAGIVGNRFKQNYGFTVGRITGLDPLGGEYNCITCKSLRLNKGDASFVDIIHTNPGGYGVIEPIGDQDFYVNCQSLRTKEWKTREVIQPACQDAKDKGLVVTDRCSSRVSCVLFAESIIYNNFLGKSCSIASIIGCFPVSYAYMGEYARKARYDIYYVETKAEPPYGLGSNKKHPFENNTYFAQYSNKKRPFEINTFAQYDVRIDV
ncbi:hypothetical protein RI129_001348 [Pyrocoelia pectoralis]|uniref:Lipase domain-containing protein n=1 Tax=Pyrocoelia pectoralis TaxID=417401 RepID=A0AAN7VU34_9COLE